MKGFRLTVFALLASLSVPLAVSAQEAGDLRLLDWRPVPQLVVKETEVLKPKYYVIDIHNHLRRLENLKEYLEQMDLAGVKKVVSLDGLSRDNFYKEHLRAVEKVSPERMVVFFSPDFSRIEEPDFGRKEAARLEQAVREGCRGLKIFKSLGLGVRDSTGELIKVDDPRIDPIWAKCGELGIPVMIHVSDPKAFFTPLDEHNERYDELGAHPDWSFYGEEWPSKEEIIAARNRVFARHPNTIFIGAHMGTLPEELHVVANWLDVYPNVYVDIDARISELGRQPRTARKFLIEYQDRVMFGTDTPPSLEAYKIYYRFLETDDEYFDPSGGHHLQGRWMIYGVYLPDEVLKKIYHGNAEKIFGMFKGVS